MSGNDHDIIAEIRSQFDDQVIIFHEISKDDIPSVWVDRIQPSQGVGLA